MKKRMLLLLLASLMLTSCGAASNDTVTSETTTAAVETTTAAETEIKPDLPDEDYDGYTFTFLNGNTTNWMTTTAVTSEKENGEAVNDAIYRRNAVTEERYNIKIAEVPAPNVLESARNSIMSGDNEYGSVLSMLYPIYELFIENMFIDLNDIPYINTDAPWWREKAMEAYSLGGKMITLGSDAHIESSVACNFSEASALIKKCGFNSLYYFENRQPREILM